MRIDFSFTIAAALLLSGFSLHAGDGKPRYYSVSTGDASPQRDILVEHYRSDRPGISPVPQQIWLVSTLDPANRRLLYTHERNADVIFSPEEDWLVINDHNLSGESRVLLFRRKGPLEYEQATDLTDAAWRFFDSQQGGKNPQGFDHAYVSVLSWAESTPPTLLLCLDGHLDSRNYTSNWYCFYDVAAKAFNVDLKGHNKRSTTLESK